MAWRKKHFQAYLKSHTQSAKAWLGLALARKALEEEELAFACLNRSLDFDSQKIRKL